MPAPSFWACLTREFMNTVQRVPRSTGCFGSTGPASAKACASMSRFSAKVWMKEPQPDEQASFSMMLSITPLLIRRHFMSWPPISMMKFTSGRKAGGPVVRHRLDLALVGAQGCLDQFLSVPGDAGPPDPRPLGQRGADPPAILTAAVTGSPASDPYVENTIRPSRSRTTDLIVVDPASTPRNTSPARRQQVTLGHGGQGVAGFELPMLGRVGEQRAHGPRRDAQCVGAVQLRGHVRQGERGTLGEERRPIATYSWPLSGLMNASTWSPSART